MKPSVYKLNTLSLFNDLKNTNIKKEDFKSILASYKSLESSYAKSNDLDLLKDLNKQRDVLFSYLPSCRKESVKKIAKLFNDLETEVGNIDELNTLNTPEKNVQFIKVAYNDGKWTIFAHNLNDAEFTDKETPEAINCLVNVANRLDEQDAAYALCHAKKAGLFTMAELPYVRTEDFTNTALETRYVKDPGTTLGPVEHSWESSVDNTNMPVSRQIASDEFEEEEYQTDLTFDDINESTELVDEDGSMLFVSAKDSDTIVANNQVYMRDEVDENLASGNWQIVKAAKEDNTLKIKRLEKSLESALKDVKEHQVLISAINKVAREYEQKIQDLTKTAREKSEEIVNKLLPKIKKIVNKIYNLTYENEECYNKLKILKLNLNGIIVKYNPEVENYQRRVVGTKEVEEILTEIRKYVSPRYIKEYEKLTEQLFTYTSRLESLLISLDESDPSISEEIEEKAKTFRQGNLKKASFNIGKDKAYRMLEDMLVEGYMNFDQYQTFTSFADINARQVIASLEELKPLMNKEVDARVFDNIIDFISNVYESAKDWVVDAFSLFTIQEKQIKDINEKLDSIIPEGE